MGYLDIQVAGNIFIYARYNRAVESVVWWSPYSVKLQVAQNNKFSLSCCLSLYITITITTPERWKEIASNYFLGLMPYNFLCCQAGCILSEINSLDQILTLSTFLKMACMALIVAASGLLSKRNKEKITWCQRQS